MKAVRLLPHAHAQGGKVIDCTIIMSTKIAISQDLGTWATRKRLESVEFCEKLASACFKSRDTIHEWQK